MKKNRLFLLGTVLSLLFVSQSIFAQKQDSIQLRTFGLGFQLGINPSLGYQFAPSVVVTINPTNYLRLEPSFSYNKSSNDELYGNNTEAFTAGIGLYGMNQYSKMNVYGGLKFEFGKETTSYNNSSYYSQMYVNGNNSLESIGVGPVVGAEYLINTHFSFGGEFGYVFMNTKDDYSEESRQFTTSKLTVHYYF